MPTVPEILIFGEGHARCPETGRPLESGIGALSKDKQTAAFVREREAAADMPRPGETCPRTGREYEVGGGAHTKSQQTARFVKEVLAGSGILLPTAGNVTGAPSPDAETVAKARRTKTP